MAYTSLGAFLTKVTKKAVAKANSADEYMRIAENVTAWANAGTITSEQVAEIESAMPVEPVVEEPSELLEEAEATE